MSRHSIRARLVFSPWFLVATFAMPVGAAGFRPVTSVKWAQRCEEGNHVLSHDGWVVAGRLPSAEPGELQAFRWSPDTGFEWLPLPASQLHSDWMCCKATAIPGDGSRIFMVCQVDRHAALPGYPVDDLLPFVYENGSLSPWTRMNDEAWPLESMSFGDFAVGYDFEYHAWTMTHELRAVHWDSSGQISQLAELDGGNCDAIGSDDGQVIVGESGDPPWYKRPGAWIDEAVGRFQGPECGSQLNRVWGLSGDGPYAVGYGPSAGRHRATYRSIATRGSQFLPYAHPTHDWSESLCILRDGALIGGNSSPSGVIGSRSNGSVQEVDHVLTDLGLGDAIAGWKLWSVDRMSADGRRIAGTGENPNGQGWIWWDGLSDPPDNDNWANATALSSDSSPYVLDTQEHTIEGEPRHARCAGDLDMPLDIRLNVDEGSLGIGRSAPIEITITAQSDLRDVIMRITVEGAAELAGTASRRYDFLPIGKAEKQSVSVRFSRVGLSKLVVEASAVIAGTDFPFGKRVEWNALLDDERAVVGLEVPRHLQIRAVRERLAEGRVTQEQADTEIKQFTRLDGLFDQIPFVAAQRTPRDELIVKQLTPIPDEPIRVPDPSSTAGGVTMRVMGLVQWQDGNGTLHPVYGMTVQVRDDETVGSEMVREMVTGADGQYDTGTFNHDDGFGAGNPDIFVRFRTNNGAIDVEDGCFGCETYENDSAIREEFPGGTIVENFTCANFGTGPACSVLTGLTWISVYASDLAGGNFLDRIRADWPGDPGSSNYACTPSCRINVQPGDRFDWDVLHHEYGHYVMDEFDFEDNPGDEHFINGCHTIDRNDKEVGIKLAWGEGWPTYFGTVGQQRLNMAALNVPRVGDVSYTETEESTLTYSLEANTGGLVPDTGLSGRGEDSELAVQRLLWDLYDANVDSRDRVTASDQTLFDIVAATDPESLAGAWGQIRARLSDEDDLAYGAVTTDHEIGPRCIAPANGAEITLANATFSWDPNVGCHTSFAGNQFDLVFYRTSDYAEALRIPGLSVTSHTLTPAEYLAVRASGPVLLWAVESRNTSSPSTGPYLGENRSIVMYVTPSNDNCGTPRPIADGSVIGTTNGATADGSDSCIVSIRQDVWFSYVASCTGVLTINTCGSANPTSISVHDACPGTYNNELGCGSGTPCTDQARMPVVNGQAVRIRAATATTNTGNFAMNVACVPLADVCDDALPVAIGGTVTGSTVGTTADAAPTCEGFDVTAPGVWYTVIGNGNELTASLCSGTTYDSKLSVYCGGCGNLECRGANDDTCNYQSVVSWCSVPGAVYHILVHGYQTNVGDFVLSLSDTGNSCGPFYLSCAPANDWCETATEVGQGSFTGDNTSSTTSTAVACRSSNSDVWYRYVQPCNGFVRISTCGATGSLADTVLSVYDGCGGREIACNDDFDGCGWRSQVTVPVYADEPIWIRVAEYGSDVSQGTFPLSVSGAGMIAPLAIPPPGLYVGRGPGAFPNHLMRIRRPDEEAMVVGFLGVNGLSGLAYAPPLGMLYGTNDDGANDSMVVVNPETGAATPIGALGLPAVQGLAFDPAGHVLYGSDVDFDVLIRVDPFSGAGTSIGPIGFGDVRALTFDPASATLYGSDVATDQLITINTATGAGIAIGPFGGGFDQVEGMAFDTVSGTLFGFNRGANQVAELIRIDGGTGAATLVRSFGVMEPTALAFIPALPDARAGRTYIADVPVGGGCPSYFFGNPTGLPNGLSLSRNGAVLGIPTQSGDFLIQFDLDDSDLSTPGISKTMPLRVFPANDECVDAIAVGGGETRYRTDGATTDPSLPTGPCESGGHQDIPADIWYCHRAECTGDLTVSLCDSDFDSMLAVYPGCECPPARTPISCNDDNNVCAPHTTGAQATFRATKGEPYLIRVGGYDGYVGQGGLSIQCTECDSDEDCEDGNLCTVNTCARGRCSLSFLSCNDSAPCTIDGCEPAVGCTHDPFRCDDDDACTSEVCVAVAGMAVCEVSPIDCSDGDDCTVDTCNPQTGCAHTLIDCDTDRECDFTDNCPTVPNPGQANGDGDEFGDACDGFHDPDHDGDVDRADFRACALGPFEVPSATCIDVHDFNGDQRIDLADFAGFQVLFTARRTSPCD